MTAATASGLILWRDGENRRGGWLRVVDGRIVQRGAGGDWRAGSGLATLPPDERAILILPVEETTLHWIACPGMTVRQGAAAAPLLALESSLGDAADLHAGVAPAPDTDVPHIVAVIDRVRMDAAMIGCASEGLGDAAIVPGALVLPPPVEGFSAAEVAGAPVLRGVDCALPGDETFTPLIVGDAPVRALDLGEIDAALVAAFAAPPLDLRQGAYARRRRSGVDGRWLGQSALLLGLAAAASLVIALVTIVKLGIATSVLDAEAMAAARPLVPQAVDVADADRRLSLLLAERGGAGGFTATVAAIAAAMRVESGVHLVSLSRMADGTVRLQMGGPNSDALNRVLATLHQAGWRIAANGLRPQGGEVVADLTVIGG